MRTKAHPDVIDEIAREWYWSHKRGFELSMWGSSPGGLTLLSFSGDTKLGHVDITLRFHTPKTFNRPLEKNLQSV